MAMHCTQKLALEKILGLHYRGFEILTPVFTQPCELAPSKNWQFSRSVVKVRLSMENGDFAELATGSCDCKFDELGLRQHLRHVRSFEKLTSEGMTFFGGNWPEL
jgi:hypothetical protein